SIRRSHPEWRQGGLPPTPEAMGGLYRADLPSSNQLASYILRPPRLVRPIHFSTRVKNTSTKFVRNIPKSIFVGVYPGQSTLRSWVGGPKSAMMITKAVRMTGSIENRPSSRVMTGRDLPV